METYKIKYSLAHHYEKVMRPEEDHSFQIFKERIHSLPVSKSNDRKLSGRFTDTNNPTMGLYGIELGFLNDVLENSFEIAHCLHEPIFEYVKGIGIDEATSGSDSVHNLINVYLSHDDAEPFIRLLQMIQETTPEMKSIYRQLTRVVSSQFIKRMNTSKNDIDCSRFSRFVVSLILHPDSKIYLDEIHESFAPFFANNEKHISTIYNRHPRSDKDIPMKLVAHLNGFAL